MQTSNKILFLGLLLGLSSLSFLTAEDEADCDPCDAGLAEAEKCHLELKANIDKYAKGGIVDSAHIDEFCCTIAKAHDCIRKAIESCRPGPVKDTLIAAAEMFIKGELQGKCVSYRYYGSSMPFKCKMVFHKERTIATIVGSILGGLVLVSLLFGGLVYYRRRRLMQSEPSKLPKLASFGTYPGHFNGLSKGLPVDVKISNAK